MKQRHQAKGNPNHRVRGTATRGHDNLVRQPLASFDLLPSLAVPRPRRRAPVATSLYRTSAFGTVIPPVCPPGPSTHPQGAHEPYQFPLQTGNTKPALCAVSRALHPTSAYQSTYQVDSFVVCCMPSTSCMCRLTNIAASQSVSLPLLLSAFYFFLTPSDPNPIRSIKPLHIFLHRQLLCSAMMPKRPQLLAQ